MGEREFDIEDVESIEDTWAMILIITDGAEGINRWCKTFGIDRPRQSNEHVSIQAVQSGSDKWESHRWDLALIDNGVKLTKDEYGRLCFMSKEVRWMDTIDWSSS